MLRSIIKSLLLTTTLFVAVAVQAQTDTLAPYRGFLTACTQYQTTPLQATVKYQSFTNLVLQPSDTISANGYFYIGSADQAYIQFGDIEQLITDSVSMMINHRVEQVLVSTDVTQARVQLRRYLGTITSDSSVVNLSKAFTIQQGMSNGAVPAPQYHLVARTNVSGTDIPRQEITLVYDSATREPKRVETLQRTLMPIDPADSAAFRTQFGNAGVLRTVQGIGLCFVREYKASYAYIQILHTAAASVPLQISDYLRKNEEGEYELVPAKEGYRLTVD
jgi:hypothetical protein